MKTRNIIILTLLAALFLACDDDDDNTTVADVTVSGINFLAAESQGYILLNGETATAQSSTAWCTLSQTPDTIHVHVTDNTDMSSRNAIVTLTYSGGTVTQIPINQQGGYFRVGTDQALLATDSAQTLSVTVESAFDYTITTDQDWITPQILTDGVTLTLQQNTTGAPRYADAVLNCTKMNKQLTLQIYQYTLDDLAGQWTAQYINSRNVQTTAVVDINTNTDGTLALTGLPQELTLTAQPLDNHTFAFTLGQDLGTYQTNYHIYIGGISATGVTYTADTETRAINYTSALTYSDGTYLCSFTPDSTFSDGTTMDGIVVTAYNAAGTKLGTVEAFRQLTLSR